MTDFFGEPDPVDPTYRLLKTSQESEIVDARHFLNTLWHETEPYLDSRVRSRAAHHFHQAFWEIYLCAALLDLRLPITPRESRRRRDEGPDLQLGDVDAWCEAIAVTAGGGRDAVEEVESGTLRSVPDEAIKLRLTSALDEKRRKFERYRTSGIVRDGEPCLVAINAALVPSARLELDVPRIVASVFGVGWPTVSVDLETGAFRRSPHTQQRDVAKANTARVSTSTFLTQDSAAVSAILYSCVDYLNRPATLGADFVLVHNPNPAARLRRGFFARGREYWKDGDQIRMFRHDPEGT